MTVSLDHLLAKHRYPKILEFVNRLKARAEGPPSIDQAEAEALLDELKHLIVKALKPGDLPI